MKNPKPFTYARINLKAIKHNLKAIRRLAARNPFGLAHRCKSVDILTVIKADAYGHGILPTARLLEKENVRFLGVSDAAEGIKLREAGLKKPIILFESTSPASAGMMIDYQLTPTVCTLELAKQLNRSARQKKKRIDVHIKVDTGMRRLGVDYPKAFDFIRAVFQLKHLSIQGLYTHFPVADTDPPFTETQLDKLRVLVKKLDRQAIVIPYIHAANSMGLAGYITDILNVFRPGLMLYGMYPHPKVKTKIALKPAMSVWSKIIFLKSIRKGDGVSYGRTFIAKKAMKIAVVPIGYNDGYFRILSNKASVLIAGTQCPVLGQVTMDQIIVDVSRVKNLRLNMSVTILGSQKSQTVTADELAALAGTINYEIICSLGNRLPRIYTKSKK